MSSFDIVGILLLIIAAAAVLVHRSRKKREAEDERLKRFAVSQGFAFQPEGDQHLVEEISAFPWLGEPGPKALRQHASVSRLFGKDAGMTRVSVFQLHRKVGGARDESVDPERYLTYDVFLYRFGARPLPVFNLRPREVFDRIGELLGSRDIRFEHQREFSNRYILRGSDGNAVRALFSDEVLSFLAALPVACTVESVGDRMAFYYLARRSRIAPAAVGEFVQEGLGLLSVMLPER
jgi:hypothetical protein